MDWIESYGPKFSLKAKYSCHDGLVGVVLSAFGSWWITAWFSVVAVLLSPSPCTQNIWKYLETLMVVTLGIRERVDV